MICTFTAMSMPHHRVVRAKRVFAHPLARLCLIISGLSMVSGCASGTSEAGLCAGLRAPVDALEAAMLADSQTPDPVGEAGTDVVIGFNAGCRA